MSTTIKETKCTCSGCGNIWFYGKEDALTSSANALQNAGKNMMCCTGCVPAIFIPEQKVTDLSKCPKCGLRAIIKEEVTHVVEDGKPEAKKPGVFQVIGGFAILLCLFFICSKSCDDNKGPSKTPLSKEDNKKIDEALYPTNYSIGEPKGICSCLEAYGFQSKYRWSDDRIVDSEANYNCQSEWTHSISNDPTNFPNIIMFNSYSDDSIKVKQINLAATVNQAGDSLIFIKYTRVVKKVFAFLKLDIPNGLLDAISGRHKFRSIMKYGIVDFRKQFGNPDIPEQYNLILNIGPPGDTIVYQIEDKKNSNKK